MKHKHCELIKAWADGADIEYFHDKSQQWLKETHPLWNENLEYRIKPKEEFLKYKVGLFKFQDGKFYTLTYYPGAYIIAEQFEEFVMWLTDEQTVDVGGLR